ncbi:MAG: hypothetical protein HZC18_07265 [Candidatus Omnitrophica bacterium]|nr:hypothetical protein [Candidatus Omnitrophota bacterium]
MPKKIDLMLAEALVARGLVAQEQMDLFLQEADGSGEGLQSALLTRGIVGEKDILTVLAGKLRIPYVQLKELTVEQAVLDKIPIKIATYYGFVPLGIRGRVLSIAVAAPLEVRARDEIRIQSGYEIETMLAEQSDIADVLEKWRSGGMHIVPQIDVSPRKEAATKVAQEVIMPAETIPWAPKEPPRSQFNKEKKFLGEILIEKGLLTAEQLALALGEQGTTKEFLGTIVVKKGWVKEKELLTALSERFNLPLVDLRATRIDWDMLQYFSSSLIFDDHCIPFARDERCVTMAISNPLEAWTIKRAEEESKGFELKLALASREDIDGAIKRYQTYMQQKLKIICQKKST